MAGRGAIDTISLEAMIYLLENLPQTQVHSDWIPGAMLESGFVQRLESEAFSGFVVFAVEQDWLGGLLFYKGKALEAWRRALGGLENRAEAYRNLVASLEFAAVRFFVLPSEVIPCIVALTLSEQIESYPALQVNVPEMLGKLSQNLFSGTVVLENSSVAQAWFFKAGQKLLEPPLPDSFSEGQVHLLHNPSAMPQDVIGLAAREANQSILAEADHLRLVFEQVLIAQVGVNAKALLLSNAVWLSESNPKRLQVLMQQWLEETYGLGLVQQFLLHLEN